MDEKNWGPRKLGNLHMVGNGVDRTPEMGVISLTYTWYSEL